MPDFPRITATCIIFVLLLAAPNARADQESPLHLDEAVALALQNNPDLAAIKARALALAETPAQKGALADPQLSLRAANFPLDTFAIDQEPMTQLQVALSQALPYPGKLSLQRQIAEEESRAADFSYSQEQLLLIRDVKMVWWNLYYLDRALETVERNRTLYRQFLTIARTKYEVGKGLQQDVLRAGLELSKLLDTKISLQNMRADEAVRLNTLVNRPPETEILLPEKETPGFPTIPPLPQLLQEAVQTSPALRNMTSMTDAARTKIKLAEMQYYPDFMAGVTYGYREGENANGSDRADFASLALTFNLPFVHREEKARAISQMRYEAFHQEQKLKSAENSVREMVATSYSDFGKYREEMELLKTGIIPQAKQTLDSMLAGYQVNKVDFLNLVEAQSSLYNHETRYWQIVSRAYQALARLAAATGKENWK